MSHKNLDPTWWNAAPGELRMDYEDYMQERATQYDLGDEYSDECVACGHDRKFHVTYDLKHAQPCDYIVSSNVHPGGRTCDCIVFCEKLPA